MVVRIGMNKQNNTVDVVIPFGPTTATRPGALTAVVRILKCSKNLGNLIIVVNGAIPGYSNCELKSLRDYFRDLQIHHVPNANLSSARNVGAEASTGDYILFCDADTMAPPETIQSMLKFVSPSVFVMGVRRKYIPLTTDLEMIYQLINRSDWSTIESVATAQPAQYSSDDYGNILPPLVMQYALFGAFGIVHRKMFEDIGGFDNHYKGWGLEDIDIIRRLLMKSNCRMLKNERVWHIDHYVEPYRHANHWQKNWKRYVSLSDSYGILLINKMLGSEFCKQCDSEVWLKPKKHRILRKRVESLKLTQKYKDVLYKTVKSRISDSDTCSVILYGSARYKRTPKDIDIITLIFNARTHDHRCSNQNSIIIEEKRLSFFELSNRIGHPGRNPDSWPFILSRFDSHWILGARLDIGKYLDTLRCGTIRKYAYHLITYHLGNAMLNIKKSRPLYITALHLASLLGITHGICPDLFGPPFFSNPYLARKLRAMIRTIEMRDEKVLNELLVKYAKAFIVNYGLSESTGQIYYPASIEGWKILCSWGINIGQPKWA